MNFRNYLLIGAIIGGSLAAKAQLIVEFSSIGGPNFVDDLGLAVPDGNDVQAGYFDGTFDLAANADSLPSLKAAWHEFGATTTSSTFFGSGQIGGSLSGSSSGLNSFENQKLFLWVFKTTDAHAPDSSFSNVSDYGLFSSTQPNWKFPADANAPPPGNRTSIFTSHSGTSTTSVVVSWAALILSRIDSTSCPLPSCATRSSASRLP